MKRLWKDIQRNLLLFGINTRKTTTTIRGLRRYYRDLKTLKQQQATSKVDFPFGKAFPCLDDRTSYSGVFGGHYFHQDLLVARRIFANQPLLHVDVGSRIDGFVTHVASFRPIYVIDIRPLPNIIPNVSFLQADLMQPLPGELADYCDSLSCLHALEHFGLGRYGDPLNYEGYLRGLENLYQIQKHGGKLYLSVPIGPQRIEFNAHRVFSVVYLLSCLQEGYHIDYFSYVDDCGVLHENAAIDEQDISNNYGCNYGCGIIEATKL